MSDWPTGKKEYRIDVDGFDMPEAYFGIEIDYDKLTQEMAREVVSFHMDEEDLRFETDGDLHAMLMLKITRWAYGWALQEDLNSHGLSSQFDEAEGWPGDGAIKFVTSHIDKIDICMDDIRINER